AVARRRLRVALAVAKRTGRITSEGAASNRGSRDRGNPPGRDVVWQELLPYRGPHRRLHQGPSARMDAHAAPSAMGSSLVRPARRGDFLERSVGELLAGGVHLAQGAYGARGRR